jgi:hypothetical protein
VSSWFTLRRDSSARAFASSRAEAHPACGYHDH